YKEQVQPDEYWHHNFGLEMLEKYATSPEAEERAKLAIRKTLSIADELREIAIAKVGCAVPGC
ncbi:MAG: ferritin-like domain-containing protein, partial [Blastocatellia bacterium]|nr:ferritin-like domain-containing protein [Blastocatellia bacterium]